MTERKYACLALADIDDEPTLVATKEATEGFTIPKAPEDSETLKYANRHGYSDVSPCEIVRHISEKCLEVRAMDYTRDPAWKPERIAGGFAGHCINQDSQTWLINSNPDNRVFKIRLNKKGRWKDRNGNFYSLASKPRRYYDYNF